MEPKRHTTKAVTVRIAKGRLERVMRARRIGTQSELINRLVMEEDERLRSHRVLRAGAGVARARDFDDRLL